MQTRATLANSDHDLRAKLGCVVAFAFGLLATIDCLAADDSIVIAYNPRPPYIQHNGDAPPTGLTAGVVAQAVHKAGWHVVWRQTPINRQIAEIREKQFRECGIGWFKTTERETFARFSAPIYQDLPTVAIVHASEKFPTAPSVHEVLHRAGLRVLIKESYSYGAYIDQALTEAHPELVRTTGENERMLEMIALKRADLIFMAREEADYLIENMPEIGRQLAVLSFRDIPPGERRHLMCSKSVSQEEIDRFNAQLPAH